MSSIEKEATCNVIDSIFNCARLSQNHPQFVVQADVPLDILAGQDYAPASSRTYAMLVVLVQSNPAASIGLHSVDEHGAPSSQCGTSYAAPLVARTLAGPNHAIEGEVSRETLLALTVHHAVRPSPFESAAIADLSRELIGFGMPQSSQTILRGHDNRITLVFAGRLEQEKQLAFAFSWPAVLKTAAGKCRGYARLTLVTHPPLDYKCGAELVHANVDAKLQQSQGDGHYKGQLHETYLPTSRMCWKLRPTNQLSIARVWTIKVAFTSI
jgi:hypothetical protein